MERTFASRLRALVDHPLIWLLPVGIPFFLFLLLPLARVVTLSLQDWDWGQTAWVGAAQYRRLARDPEFWRAFLHTLLFAAAVVPAWIFLTLAIASMVAPLGRRARGAWMTAFYLTYMVSPVVLALVWRWMLAPDADGLINRALAALHLGPFPWLTSPRWALASVILSTIFTIPGSGVVIYAAAIAGLPAELYEAAHLEGAGPLTCWWRITVPLLRPTTLYLTVVYTIASFQVFERVYVMTGGGPGGATSVIVYQIYSKAFLDFDFGAAAAQSVILLALIAAVAGVQFKTLKSDVQY